MELLDYFYNPNILIGASRGQNLDPMTATSPQFFNFNPNRPKYYIPGTQHQNSKQPDSLKVTALDLENSEAGPSQGGSGGPQRTNAYNRLGTVRSDGTYEVRGSSPYPLSPTPGGTPLRGRNGTEQFTLNAYTPKETYMQSVKTYKDRYKTI